MFQLKLVVHKIEKEFVVIYSRLTDIELSSAPENVRNLAESISKTQLEFVDITDEATRLADEYIVESVVGKTSRADCLHIALATIYEVDILVSWNFRHIININRIRGYNSVNNRLGYKALEIRTPREILEYEN